MNVGISVSRVGGAAQIKAMKKVRRRFATGTWPPSASWKPSPIGHRLDAATQSHWIAAIAWSSCSSRDSTSLMDVFDEVLSIYAGNPRPLGQVPA